MSQTKVNNIILEVEKLKELKDDELRDRIVDVNRAQLSKIGEMSYNYFISVSGDLLRLINVDNFLEKIDSQRERELIQSIFEYNIRLFKKIHMGIEKNEIEDEIATLLDMREELYSLLNAIHCYETELSYIKESLDYHTMKKIGEKEYRNALIDKNEIVLLIDKIGEVLAKNINNHLDFVSIVSNIISILPFRMSKSKYFDIVKTTLTRNLNQYPVDMAENQIENYKILFDSSLAGDYGIVFDVYFTRVQSIKNIDYKTYSLEELDNLAKDIINLAKELNEVEVFLVTLGTLINRLISILLIKNKSLLNIDSKKLYSIWEKQGEELDEKRLSSLRELSNNSLKEVEKQLLKDIQYFEVLNGEGLKRPGFLDKSLNKEMLFTNRVLTFYNDISLTKYETLFPKETQAIDKYYLEQLIDSLIQYINRSISSMDNIERKIRMRRLLSALQLPFEDIEEFLFYIEYSLDERVVSKEEILFTIDGINYWLDNINEGQ
ncbi:hypothetical protein [Clostridium sp. Cult3]|uniref:hypothetical protein n=1 Tax=Clostridium sp. Cult3 TaxID=2079004 RepID=UPI001F3FCE2B|nr:hypothetical protein [Clostridium sp. Cult3]MCF6459622.1 hypothetical protein [Clostridium sp. Cult3]